MARLGRSLLYALGVLLLLVGGVAALYVGPSDTVRLPTKAVPDGAPVTVLGWRLLGYRDSTLEVVATASEGDVFLGAANPVDVDSYVAGARVLDVRTVSPVGSLSGQKVGPDGGTLAPAPATLSFWTVSVAGSGEQRLRVPLTGDPVSVVVVAPPGSELTAGLGARVLGLFRSAALVALAGLLLIVVAVLLSRRAKRGQRLDGADVAGVERVERAERAEREGAQSVRGTMRRRVVPTVVLLGCPVLAGCVAPPQSVAEPSAGPTKLALAADQASVVLADYDARNNAAIAALVQGADEKTWASADAGPAYFSDVVSTAAKRTQGGQVAAGSFTHVATDTYAARFGSYPMWAMVSGRSQTQGSTDPPRNTVWILVRESVTEPWRLWSSIGLTADVPPPLSAMTDATASAEEQAAREDLAGRIAAYLGDGTDPRLTTGDTLKTWRDGLLSYDVFTAKAVCKPMVAARRPGDAVRVVRAAGGHLVAATLRCEQTIFAPAGQTIFWQPDHAKALGTTTDSHPTLTRVLSVTVLLRQAPDGTAAVVGQTSGEMRADDADWVQ